MSKQQPDVQPQVSSEEERKPVVFAVRIDPVLREQIEGLRGITEQSVNDVGVEALDDWVTKTLADEAIQEKSMAEFDAEEKRLQERRATIADILGQRATRAETASEAAPEAGTTSRGERRSRGE